VRPAGRADLRVDTAGRHTDRACAGRRPDSVGYPIAFTSPHRHPYSDADPFGYAQGKLYPNGNPERDPFGYAQGKRLPNGHSHADRDADRHAVAARPAGGRSLAAIHRGLRGRPP
jgi:hypothetical protein